MKKTYTWLAGLLAAMCLLAGCGAVSADRMSAESSSPAQAPEEMMGAANGELDMLAPDTSGATAGKTDPSVKRIYTATLELETTGFDNAVKGFTALAEECGGYLESSSIRNRGSGYRGADYTVRVPVEQYRHFLEQAGALSHVLYMQEYVEDISEVYYDTAGRLKTQQIKLERLQMLLAKAEKMEDILAIESSISETEQQIDDLSGTLQHYDAQVDYATVNLTLQEVYRLSNVEEPAVGFFGRMGTAFASGWKSFVAAAEGFAVGLAYGWVWVLLAAVVVWVVVLRLRKKPLHFPRRKKLKDHEE